MTLYALLLLVAGCVWDWAEHEVHLIPDGYEGPVLIIFDDSSGAPESRERGARVYQIPPTGVLRTRFGFNSGWGRPAYYYVDAAGRRTRVVWGGFCEDSVPRGVIRACQMPTISPMGRTTPDYVSYIIGREAKRREMQRRWEQMVREEALGENPASAPQEKGSEPPETR